MKGKVSDRVARVAGALLTGMILCALLAPVVATDRPWIARTANGEMRLFPIAGGEGVESILSAPVPHAPNSIDLARRLRAPSRTHPLGTDQLGRDVLSRIIHGSRVSLLVGTCAGLLALIIGVSLGIAAGSLGGFFDALVLRLIEVALCFPFYFVALAVVAILEPSVSSLLLALTLTSWTAEARLVRGEVLKIRNGGIVETARSSGAGTTRIILRHVMPNVITPAIVSAGFGIAAAILAESALSFLGFGVPLPLSSWGSMLAAADDHLFVAWWLAVFPGLAIVITTGSIQVLAERARRSVAVESPVARSAF